MSVDIKKLDTRDLKALAFDTIAEQEKLKYSLDTLLKEIHAREHGQDNKVTEAPCIPKRPGPKSKLM